MEVTHIYGDKSFKIVVIAVDDDEFFSDIFSNYVLSF